MSSHGGFDFYPENTIAFSISFVVLFIISVLNGSISSITFTTIKLTSFFIILEAFVRCVQFILYLYKERNSACRPSKVLRQIFNFNAGTKFITAVVVVVAYLISDERVKIFSDIWQYMPFYCAYLMIKTLKIDESDYNKTMWMTEADGLDYGSGMAYSFFYGYLNIVLPNKGTVPNDSNIKGRMEEYESRENIRFGLHQMVILIPKHLYCPPDISTLSKKDTVRMEVCKSLETVIRHRAGVQERVYKNTVYKIVRKNENKPFYLVVEGATPLLTLFDSLKNATAHQQVYEKNKEAIVMQFYRMLKKLIETDIECKDLCKLIYYDIDEIEDIGEFILKELNL